MEPIQIVLDTNVLVSALRSHRGASYKVLELLESNKFEINISVPMICEYEQSALNIDWPNKQNRKYIDDILDYICERGNKWKIYFLWRPRLSDPKDDMVLELAVVSGSKYIVTYNKSDFRDAREFGITVLDPKQLLQKLGVIK